jgi:hypothetical protein
MPCMTELFRDEAADQRRRMLMIVTKDEKASKHNKNQLQKPSPHSMCSTLKNIERSTQGATILTSPVLRFNTSVILPQPYDKPFPIAGWLNQKNVKVASALNQGNHSGITAMRGAI